LHRAGVWPRRRGKGVEKAAKEEGEKGTLDCSLWGGQSTDKGFQGGLGPSAVERREKRNEGL